MRGGGEGGGEEEEEEERRRRGGGGGGEREINEGTDDKYPTYRGVLDGRDKAPDKDRVSCPLLQRSIHVLLGEIIAAHRLVVVSQEEHLGGHIAVLSGRDL